MDRTESVTRVLERLRPHDNKDKESVPSTTKVSPIPCRFTSRFRFNRLRFRTRGFAE